MATCFDKELYTTYYDLICRECGRKFVGKAKNQLRCDDCRTKKRFCKDCGAIINEKSYQYCKSCREKKIRPRYYPACDTCGKIFETGRPDQRFCSKECRYNSIAAVQELRTCPVCGTEFVSVNARQKFCSRKCQKNFNGSSNSYDRRISSDRRLLLATSVDKSVRLLPLIKRDNNICALCGEPCDLYDYEPTEIGTIITGENYPSIDHIIPLSKGGLHRWDNVQLAHRKCNREKGNGENFKRTADKTRNGKAE